ncbi:MAG TPA: capsular polysaccharide biosynthesis protein [Candidatus Faeciplasma avium]|uniref:protein-tyrosine-phosphatase n=1 Tax=Candidatus Faeciplasma avium TaxID=2840798 RepID=A0A9D1NQT3_9FIRM|nr:capsular polysaccharide biosynthesis protein [Candidatus Faeciplasma avium]
MIDFHSHILPGMDDGAKTPEESIELLKLSFRQGVSLMCATPHFYPWENTPKEFLARRRRSWELLKGSLAGCSERVPKILLGAEVAYFEGIARSHDIDSLKLDGTGIILLEMPFLNWTARMWEEVTELSLRRDTVVMLAHIERYLHFGAREYLTNLPHRSIIIQTNGEAFIQGPFKRRSVSSLLRRGAIDVLGSDCHNLELRAPNLRTASEQIKKHLGESFLVTIEDKSRRLLESFGITGF